MYTWIYMYIMDLPIYDHLIYDAKQDKNIFQKIHSFM